MDSRKSNLAVGAVSEVQRELKAETQAFEREKLVSKKNNVPTTVVSKGTPDTEMQVTTPANEVDEGASSSARIDNVTVQNPIEGPSFVDRQTRT